MSNYKERIISALENQKKKEEEEELFWGEYFEPLLRRCRRSYSKNTTPKTPEEIKAEQEKRKKEVEEKAKKELENRIQYAKRIFESNREMLINNTLETFIAQMNNGISPNVSYEIGVWGETSWETTSELKKIIISELQKELPDEPNMSLKVSVKNVAIDHKHKETNERGFYVEVLEFTEYKLIIKINLTF